nr:NEAT domain-containing protein [uncultured Peptostreptococcus sp.]
MDLLKLSNRNTNRFLIRKIISIIMIIALLSTFMPDVSAANPPDGIYKVNLSLMKKYDEEKSMGNGAFVPTGFVTVKAGKARLKIKMIALSAFNFKGYLSELLVKDKPVDVLSRYDEYDVYNNPTNGKDARFKGVKYPKEMEFDVEWGEKDLPVQVYVPVMGELASGEQKARLRVQWPSNISSVRVSSTNFDPGSSVDTSSSEDTSPNADDLVNKVYQSKDTRDLPPLEKGENISLDPGIYRLTVSLHHEREDRASMGNNALIHDGELISKDGKYTFLLGSTKMEVSNIIASLVSLQIRDDNAYYHFAQPHAFDLSIPGEQDKRPEVFSFDLVRKDPMIYVKVDPKVKPMGEVPVGARLKFDWSSLKKIDESQSVLYKKMLNGTPRKKFDPKESIHKILPEGFELLAQAGAFKENIVFKVNPVTGGSSFQKVTQKFGRSTVMKIFEFKIENDYGVPTKPSKDIKIKARIPANLIRPKVYRLSDMAEMKSSISGDYISFTVDTYGEYAFVSTGKNSNVDKKTSKNPQRSGLATNKTSGNRKSTSIKPTNKASSSSNSSPASITSLKNEATDFSDGDKNVASQENENKAESSVKPIKAKENPKVIFYCVLILGTLIIGSIYTYFKFCKRFLYEMKYKDYLKNKMYEYSKSKDIL